MEARVLLGHHPAQAEHRVDVVIGIIGRHKLASDGLEVVAKIAIPNSKQTFRLVLKPTKIPGVNVVNLHRTCMHTDTAM